MTYIAVTDKETFRHSSMDAETGEFSSHNGKENSRAAYPSNNIGSDLVIKYPIALDEFRDLYHLQSLVLLPTRT
jgi:hypothetical protein